MSTSDPSAAERMRRMRARRRAAGLREHRAWVASEPPVEVWSDHRIADVRSLALHALIARKVARDPTWLDHARRNLERWTADGDVPEWATAWASVLRRSPSEVAAFLVSPSDEATRLRQSSPFAGVLTDQERRAVFEAFRESR